MQVREEIGFEKSASQCPFDRGGGGLKLFGQCPYMETTHLKMGLPLAVDFPQLGFNGSREVIDIKVCHLSRVNICSSTECDPVVASDGTGEGSSLQIQHWSSLIVRTISQGVGVAVSTAGILHGDVVEGDGGVDFPPLVLISTHHQCWRP